MLCLRKMIFVVDGAVVQYVIILLHTLTSSLFAVVGYFCNLFPR